MSGNSLKIGRFSSRRSHRYWLIGGGIVAGIALFVLDELLFGLPIIALAELTTPAWAFILLVPVYFLFDYLLGTATLNGVKRWKKTGHQNKWSKKFYETEHSRLGKFARWLLISGGIIGFIISSWLFTAFLTMPIVYLLGQRRHLDRLTAISAMIYALTFVGQYAGLVAILSN